jgi:hypothetical protein
VAIWKEWRCAAHGDFEGYEGKCPHGCSERFVTREIRSAPGLKGDRTKAADWAINALAEDFGYTDINNSPSRGNSVAEYATAHGKKISARPTWGEVQHAQPGFSQDASIAVPTVTPQQFGVQPDAAPAALIAGRRGRGIPTKQVLRPKDA